MKANIATWMLMNAAAFRAGIVEDAWMESMATHVTVQVHKAIMRSVKVRRYHRQFASLLFILQSCLVTAGYEGAHCEIIVSKCQSKNVHCRNNGRCVEVTNGFRCDCANGFKGKGMKYCYIEH